MAKVKKNKNEVLRTPEEIEAITFKLEDFEYKNDFRLLCRLHPNKTKERFEIFDAVDDGEFNINRPALLYIFVID